MSPGEATLSPHPTKRILKFVNARLGLYTTSSLLGSSGVSCFLLRGEKITL